MPAGISKILDAFLQIYESNPSGSIGNSQMARKKSFWHAQL